MYANVITTRFKSPEDLEAAVAKLDEQGPPVEDEPGFQALVLVRTGETKTTHTVVFDTPEHAKATREKLFPRFEKLVGEHLDGDPTVEPGEVLIQR